MTSKILSVVAVVLAFRGSYLIRTAENSDQSDYGRLVSISACILAMVALAMKV
jgi:hypothetical protein